MAGPGGPAGDVVMPAQEYALALVRAERLRQDRLHGDRTPAGDSLTDGGRLTVLVEEVGEVARAMLDDPSGGRLLAGIEDELVQVAAVCVAWLEHIIGGRRADEGPRRRRS